MKNPKNCLDGLTFKLFADALKHAGITTGRSHLSETGSNGAANIFIKKHYDVSLSKDGFLFKSKPATKSLA